MQRTKLTIEELKKVLNPTRAGGEAGHLYLCKSSPFGDQFARDSIFSTPAIDEENLTVRMRITTPQVDRVNHVMIPDGVILDEYRANPVVLYGHGLEGIQMPVALAEDKEGNLQVAVEPDGIYSVAHHNKSNKLSMQFFDLIVQKFLRCSSVGCSVFEASKGHDEWGDLLLFVEKWGLNEWSYCTVPVNPGSRIVKSSVVFKEIVDLQCEVANRILERNSLDGGAIDPVIRKSLEASVVKTTTTRGFGQGNKEQIMLKSLKAEQVKNLSPKQLVKAMSDLQEYDEQTQGMLQFATESLPDTLTPAVGPQTLESDDHVVVDELEKSLDVLAPQGAQVLESIHRSLLEIVEISLRSLAPVEADDIREQSIEIVESVREAATAIEGIYAQRYSEVGSLMPVVEEPTEDLVKSFLAQNKRGRDQLDGLGARLNMIVKSVRTNGSKLTPQHLQILSQTGVDLAKINDAAKSFKPQPAAAPEGQEEYKLAIAELTKSVQSVVGQLGSLPAPIK